MTHHFSNPNLKPLADFETAKEFIVTRTTEIRRYTALKAKTEKGSVEYRYYGQRIKRLRQELGYMKSEARRVDPIGRIHIKLANHKT